jgi:FKBP-type peptidyl-prolyl cis-trans isomerase
MVYVCLSLQTFLILTFSICTDAWVTAPELREKTSLPRSILLRVAEQRTMEDATPSCDDDTRRKMVGLSLLLASSSIPGIAWAKDLKEEYRQGTAALGGMDEMAPVPREAYQKLPSGVIYADVRPGKGETAKLGSKVNLQWVLRKSNGYFVDSSQVNDSVPFVFTVGDQTAIPGLDEAIRGMSVGGVRRILIPPSLAYVKGVDDQFPGPIPTGFGPRQQIRRIQNVRKDVPGEYIYLEIQLTRLR